MKVLYKLGKKPLYKVKKIIKEFKIKQKKNPKPTRKI